MQAEELTGIKKASLSRTLRQLYTEGGILGLWKPGLTASICREFLYSGPRAGFYVPVRNFIKFKLSDDLENDSFICKILAAMTTG